MKIDRAAFPLIIAALLPAFAFVLAGRPVWASAFVVLAGLLAWFFRDPERQVPGLPDAVVAPADGRVMAAGRATGARIPAGIWQQITIFLSPLDVHINRIPIAGRVGPIAYRPGRFLPAYRPESSENEQAEFPIDHQGQTVIVRQVVGVLARRVVCRLREGQIVATGERFGLMKFGSRMDVFLPASADLRVRAGDRVRGGETILAVLKP
jgi:phosphatidylserine decarboxylase